MSYIVKKAFFDKTDDRKPYSKGDSYTHDDENRTAFLIEKGFLEPKSKRPDKTAKESVEAPGKESQPKKTRKKASE